MWESTITILTVISAIIYMTYVYDIHCKKSSKAYNIIPYILFSLISVLFILKSFIKNDYKYFPMRCVNLIISVILLFFIIYYM
jgi:hypothetical protein